MNGNRGVPELKQEDIQNFLRLISWGRGITQERYQKLNLITTTFIARDLDY